MRNSKLSDREIEDLLRQLPQVSDSRPASEIYRNLVIKKKKKKKRLPNWFISGIAIGAVFFLLILLSPPLGLWGDQADENSYIEQADNVEHSPVLEDGRESSLYAEDRMVNKSTSLIDNEKSGDLDSMVEPTAVYSTDAEGHQTFTYAIPDPDAQVIVPVTVLIKKMRNKTWFEQYEETMAELTEEKWGLADYYPLNADLSYDQASQTVQVNVPVNHQYGSGSTAEVTFMSSLQESFPIDKVKKLVFLTDGKKGIQLGNHGDLFEIQMEKYDKQAYYFFYTRDGDKPYLVPTNDSFASLSEAIEEMKVDREQYGLKASLPPEVDLEVLAANDSVETVKMKISAKGKLTSDFLYSFEALMLTAKNFGYSKIKLEGNNIEQIGPFNLAEEIPLPLAPNKRSIEPN